MWPELEGEGTEWRDFEFMGLSKASIFFFFCFVRKRSVCLIVSIVGVVNMFVMLISTSFLAVECRIKERTERENVGCFTSLLFILSCIHAIIHSPFPSVRTARYG